MGTVRNLLLLRMPAICPPIRRMSASRLSFRGHHHVGTLGDYRYNATGTGFKWETKDFTRSIHWVEIKALEPDTLYFFRAGCGKGIRFFSPEKVAPTTLQSLSLVFSLVFS